MSKTVKLQQYPYSVRVFREETPDAYEKALRRQDPCATVNARSAAVTTGIMPDGFILVWLPKSASAGTTAHEMVHVAQMVFDGIGEEHDVSETFAYLVGFLVDWIHGTDG